MPSTEPSQPTRITFVDIDAPTGDGMERTEETPAVREEQGDPAEKIFSIYVAKADEHDKALIEGWNADLDGMVIFVSASRSAFPEQFYILMVSEGRFVLCRYCCIYGRQLQKPQT